MSDAAQQLSDDLGILLQRRLRTTLHAEVVAGVHDAIDVNSYPVISGVARTGPISAAALGAEIGVDRSLASRKAASLVSAGLLRSSPDPADRRATLLDLTEEGRRVVDTLRRNLTVVIDERLRHWSASDRHELAGLFGRFVHDLTNAKE